MSQEPYLMDELSRALVRDAIREHCKYRAWPLLATHVRSNHVHVVLEAEPAPEKRMNELKAYASRKLNRAGFDGLDRRRWARHGSTRYLWTREQIESAIAYVIDGQGEAMAMYVNDDRW